MNDFKTSDQKDANQLIEAALGKRPLTTLIRDVDLLNVFSGETYRTSIGIYRDVIVNIANTARDMKSEQIIDGAGKVAIPGLIDTHLHIESTMLTPANFAAAVLPHGTTTVCADPHEIGNVLGKEGVRMMLENARGLPMKIFFFAPTCVPECEAVTAGAEILSDDIEEMLRWDGICGLGEVMDFPGVISGNEKMLRILEVGRRENAVIDGHCVFLTGNELNAYITAGPNADHENFTVESALEKMRSGMYVKLRGPHILNVKEAVSALHSMPKAWNTILVTDDVMPDNLLRFGHLDYVCRTFIQNGMDPVEAVRSATLRPAEHMRMHHLGAIAPGRVADIVLVNNLTDFEVDTVLSNGELVASKGRLMASFMRPQFNAKARDTVKVKQLSVEDFQFELPIRDGRIRLNVIDFKPAASQDSALSFMEMLVTNPAVADAVVKDGRCVSSEIAVAFVFERHGKTGKRGIGFVRGLIRAGAVASTVAHDAHNLIVVGANQKDMLTAAQHVINSNGGLAAVKEGKVLASIELPVAGLMSEQDLENVATKMTGLREAFKEMGVLDHPYMPLVSLLTLAVIPHVRLTDKGIFDVDRQQFVDPLVTQ
jgi:adenine deaminase